MLNDLVSKEFAPRTTYLNTASMGLPPARTVRAMREDTETWAAGAASPAAYDAVVAGTRASFARLVGAPVEQVSFAGVTSMQVGLVATSLPQGAEVVLAEGEFSSVVQPFAVRSDLRLRFAPLDRLAEAVRPQTDLVAVSAVQSADGRLADFAAIREAARDHGARTLLDATQAVGWLPLVASDWDYLVCGLYKWLMCPRGVSFMVTGPQVAAELRPVYAGWYAGEDPWTSTYGIVTLARSARRFDTAPVWPSFVGALASLRLVEEIGVHAIGAHNTALAARFCAGLDALGLPYVGGASSAIVAVPGLGHAAPRLAEAGVQVASRAGGLRLAFHLYNGKGDVDRVLDVLDTL